jgi:DNA-binding transcriptional LysR family regulator
VSTCAELQPRLLCGGDLDDAFLMLEAVARGGFVAFIPRGVAREAIKQGRVKGIGALATRGTGVHAIYHGGDGLRQARAVVDLLLENARQNAEAT